MIRFYLRLIMIPIALFTLVLILIHAQPYDDHELRELLLPEGCPAPCFMGIRPGVTTMDEAVKLLNASSWIKQITFRSSTYISWNWSTQSPNWVDKTIEGSVSIYNDTITYMELGTLLYLGDILLEMPTNGLLERLEYHPHEYSLYTISYPDDYLHFDFTVDCKKRIPYIQSVSLIIDTNGVENNLNPTLSFQKLNFRC